MTKRPTYSVTEAREVLCVANYVSCMHLHVMKAKF
jgi:hypothetical protein